VLLLATRQISTAAAATAATAPRILSASAVVVQAAAAPTDAQLQVAVSTLRQCKIHSILVDCSILGLQELAPDLSAVT
jgi:hypothetical protein